jgi:archaellum biogenesis ATPase FlaH
MNLTTIRQWYEVFKDGHELVELRIIDGFAKRTYSGYFADVETIISALAPYDRCNIYFTLNTIDEACYSREQRNLICQRPKSTTSDKEILTRKWCLIDIDCEKPSDTNATDAEKRQSQLVANNVYAYLKGQGFNEPVICDSANGVHLLYRTDIPNTDANTATMKAFLQMLDVLFSTDKVKIDTTTYNASRICKLYGTVSRKGSDTPERPQRESKILRVPDEVKETAVEYFEKIASLMPKPEIPDRSNGYRAERFDLEGFIQTYGIKIARIQKTAAYTKYVLAECPFDSSHTAPDAALFQLNSGAIGFRCLHNSCSGYTWKDFRLHYDKNAYDKRTRDAYGHKMLSLAQVPTVTPITPEKGPKWLELADIEYTDMSNVPKISSGYTELDKAMLGFVLGEVTLLSGLNGSGKSSLIDCFALNAVLKGARVGIWSGEMRKEQVMRWIAQTAAGKDHVVQNTNYDNLYFAPRQVAATVNEWLRTKLVLYNNSYGNKCEQLLADVKEAVRERGLNFVMIDNLMATDISSYGGDGNSNQKSFILDVKSMAETLGIHVLLVVHPRKTLTFLRKEDIAGSADITNLCDNLLIMHRVDRDFITRATEFFDAMTVSDCTQYDNVIEIAKNRDMGAAGKLVGLYFEIESRRFKNSVAEHIVLPCFAEPKQIEITEETFEQPASGCPY